MFSYAWNRHFKGIRFRLTFVYSSLFGLSVFVFAFVITNQHFKGNRVDFDSALFNYGIDLSEHLFIDTGAKVNFKIPDSVDRKSFPFLLTSTFYVLRAPEGLVLAKSHEELPFSEVPFDPNLASQKNYNFRLLTFKSNSVTFRAMNLKVVDKRGQELILQVATSLEDLLEREHSHLLVTSSIVILLIFSTGVFSYFLAGNVLAPIKDLTDAANKIAAQNLSLRVPEIATRDEVAELAKTLNHLLERFEKSFKAQESFVANVSHQLNTPLSIIKGELDLLEKKPRSSAEYSKFFLSLREELERLIDLVKKMLLIARVESGLDSFSFSTVRIDELLISTYTRLGPKARDAQISFKFNIDEELSPTELEVKGERQLLSTMFENLIENAIKYSPQNSTLQLDIKKSQEGPEIHIKDEGPGMDELLFQEMLTKRFERGAGVSIPGTGIGLPIAHKIAEFHNARILYKKLNDQGSLFIIKFCLEEGRLKNS